MACFPVSFRLFVVCLAFIVFYFRIFCLFFSRPTYSPSTHHPTLLPHSLARSRAFSLDSAIINSWNGGSAYNIHIVIIGCAPYVLNNLYLSFQLLFFLGGSFIHVQFHVNHDESWRVNRKLCSLYGERERIYGMNVCVCLRTIQLCIFLVLTVSFAFYVHICTFVHRYIIRLLVCVCALHTFIYWLVYQFYKV